MQPSIANNRARIGHVVSNSNGVDIRLTKSELFAMPGDRRGTRLLCLAGGLWVTQSGDAEDHYVPCGEGFEVSRKGPVVVTGLPCGVLRVR